MAHTPGTWKHGDVTSRISVLYGDTEGMLCREVTGGGYWIAQVAPLAITHSKAKSDAEWLEEGLANARLIAAAPDLYAALFRILQTSRDADCGDHCPNTCMYCQGRAAIAKAEGL